MLLLMLLALAPGKAMADDDLSSYYYYTTEDGTAKQLSTLSGYSFAKVESSTTTFSDNTVYVVTEDSIAISDRITCGAGVILVLLDGKKMNAQSGITVEGESSITITSGGSSETIAGTGYLFATTKKDDKRGSFMDAGIGGTYMHGAGSITINGGTVTACSANESVGYGAGIGGGRYGSGDTITINGGKVTAYSSNKGEGDGAGIGAGSDESGGTLSILGQAVVEAKGTQAIKCDEAKASVDGLTLKVEYDKEECLQSGEVNLLNFNDGKSLSNYKYAKITFAEKFYSIDFIDSNSIVKTRYVLPNSDVKSYEYTKEGYAFDGWCTDAELKNLYDFDTPVTADIKLYANMSKLLTVTFKDGDTVVNEQTVHKDSTATSYQYEKEGYNFIVWCTNADLTKEFDFSGGVTCDTTLYAKLDPYKYTVIYTVNDSVMRILNAEYDKPFSLKTPTKDGYTFAGWTASEVDDAAMSGTSEDNLTSWDGTTTTNSYFMNITKEEGAKVLFTAEWNEGGSSSEGDDDDEGEKSFDLTVSSYGVATMYLDYAVKIPYDEYDKLLAVGYVCDVTDDEMVLKRLDDYIPANTGVVIFASSGTYTFKQTTKDVDALTDSKLAGVTAATDTLDIIGDGSGIIYSLGKNTESHYVGFYHLTAAQLQANKAYYLSTDGNGAKYFTFGFASGTNGIEEFLYDNGKTSQFGNGFYYDLKGQIVTDDATKLPNGIYIKNGRKVVVNKQ